MDPIYASSILTNLLAIVFSFYLLFRFFEISFAFSKPICLIPKAKINFSNGIVLFIFIEYFRLETDCFPHPSRFSITVKSI